MVAAVLFRRAGASGGGCRALAQGAFAFQSFAHRLSHSQHGDQRERLVDDMRCSRFLKQRRPIHHHGNGRRFFLLAGEDHEEPLAVGRHDI